MRYGIMAQKRAKYPGFRRSGRFFSSVTERILDESEITPEILAEKMLIVREIPDAEAEPIEQVDEVAPTRKPVKKTKKAKKAKKK